MRNYDFLKKKTSFPAIWAGLSESQRDDLRVKLVVAIRVKDNTLFRWYTGRNFPSDFSTRRDVAQVVSDFVGRVIAADDLFPSIK